MKITAAVTESRGALFAVNTIRSGGWVVHDFDQIEQAAQDAGAGRTSKPVLRMS